MDVAYCNPVSEQIIAGSYKDGIRISEGQAIVEGNYLFDDDPTDDLHQDFIQLIPYSCKVHNAQFAAAELCDVTIDSNIMHSTGMKQGICCFDGLLINLRITNNLIVNKRHPITLCGLLSGCLTANLDANYLAPILLEPLRIGGNSGDGNLWIVGFKSGSNYDYSSLNEIILDGEVGHVTDNRRGHKTRGYGRYLTDFDLENFREVAFSQQHTPQELQALALNFGRLL